MKTRKIPLRTCVACGREADKREFVRVVRAPDGEVIVDPTGKANGRGANVCSTTECFEQAVKRRRFAAALRVNLHEEDVERLRKDFERVSEQVGPNRRDGR